MMSRTRLLVVILVAFLSVGARGAGAQVAGVPTSPTQIPGTPISISPSGPPSNQGLGYGFGASLDYPYYWVGSEAVASLFFFNQSPLDAFGFGQVSPVENFVYVLDEKGRLVRGPCREMCPMIAVAVGPISLPSGTFRRFEIPLPLTYYSSDTGDPTGSPLPGGLYILQATQAFTGPDPDASLLGWQQFPGGNPQARIPFRIYQCTRPAGPLPIRELAQGSFSGYGNNDPNFFGEDLILRSASAGLQFWQQHSSLATPPPDPPAVDLSQETVLVSLLGRHQRSSGESVRIISAVDQPCHVQVFVQAEGFPAPPSANASPFQIVAIPRTLKEVVFVHLPAN